MIFAPQQDTEHRLFLIHRLDGHLETLVTRDDVAQQNGQQSRDCETEMSPKSAQYQLFGAGADFKNLIVCFRIFMII